MMTANKTLLTFLGFLILTFPVLGQTDKPSTASLVERAEMVAEIKKLREENGVLKTQNSALENQINQLNKLDQLQESRISELKQAIQAKDNALLYSEKIEKLYEQRVSDYREENSRLRGENEKLRSSKNKYGVIGLISGVVLTLVLK